MEVDDFLGVTASGFNYIKMDQGDFVKSVMLCYSHDDVLVFDDKKVMRIPIDNVPSMKRAARGNSTIKSNTIDNMTRVDHTVSKDYMIVITHKGKINKIPLSGIPGMNAVKKAFSVIRLGKDDSIQNIILANDTDKIAIRCFGMDEIIIDVLNIPMGSSITAGEKVVSTRNANIIYSVLRY